MSIAWHPSMRQFWPLQSYMVQYGTLACGSRLLFGYPYVAFIKTLLSPQKARISLCCNALKAIIGRLVANALCSGCWNTCANSASTKLQTERGTLYSTYRPLDLFSRYVETPCTPLAGISTSGESYNSLLTPRLTRIPAIAKPSSHARVYPSLG